MAVDAPNMLMAMVEVLLSSDGSEPVVIYTDAQMEDTVRLLPAGWRDEYVEEGSFGSRVSGALTSGPVVAFPPWGRQDGSRMTREAAALSGVNSGEACHDLLLVVPATVLVSEASQSLRANLSTHWQLTAVVSCSGAILNAHHSFMVAVIMLSPRRLDRPLLRMFEVPLDWREKAQAVLDDFRNLLRREGGATQFGYVLRETPEVGAALDFRLYDPRIVSRRQGLSDYGRTTHLGDLFEIVTGVREASYGRRRDIIDPAAPGASRLVSGREVLRTNVIAPVEDDSRWVTVPGGQLQTGDIVVRAMHPSNPDQTGLVWARVIDSDLPLVAGSTVVVLRPRVEASASDIDFVLRYLSSRHALELSLNPPTLLV